jgi:CBS-domain-containing membrane protein
MLTAKDIMTKDVVTVTPDTSIEELSNLLVANEISGVPVVNAGGAIVGIVTENDLISRNKRLHIPTVVSFLDAVIYLESSKKFAEDVKRLTATKVGDICAKKVVTIAEDTTSPTSPRHVRKKSAPASAVPPAMSARGCVMSSGHAKQAD